MESRCGRITKHPTLDTAARRRSAAAGGNLRPAFLPRTGTSLSGQRAQPVAAYLAAAHRRGRTAPGTSVSTPPLRWALFVRHHPVRLEPLESRHQVHGVQRAVGRNKHPDELDESTVWRLSPPALRGLRAARRSTHRRWHGRVRTTTPGCALRCSYAQGMEHRVECGMPAPGRQARRDHAR